MDPDFTIFADGPAAIEGSFAEELAAATHGEVERESPKAGLHDVVAFVVEHKEEIKTALDLAPAAVKLVAGLLGLVERRKMKLTLADGPRRITIETDRRADLEQMMTAILRRSRAIAE